MRGPTEPRPLPRNEPAGSLDDKDNRREVFVIALGLLRLDPDEVGPGRVNLERGTGACLRARLEVHLEGSLEHDVVLDSEVGNVLLGDLPLAGDVEMNDHVLESLVRVDVGQYVLNLDRLAGFQLENGPRVL